MTSMELEALAAAAARRRKLDQEHMKKQKQEELEVTGVSRSGRVRKKSSKLMDFESPDDMEPRFRRLPPPTMPGGGGGARPPGGGGGGGYHQPEHGMHYADNGRDDGTGSDSDPYENNTDNPDSMEWESSGSEGDGGGGPATRAPPPAAGTPAHHSLYMTEKSARRRPAAKDGRGGGKTKAQRKDKGQRKSHITAYMLWARGARHELIKNYPEMDFSAISKRLGEMWANVNFQERHMWKRKAKRCAMKQDEQPANKIISNAAPPPVRTWSAAPAPRPPRAPPRHQPAAAPTHHQGLMSRVDEAERSQHRSTVRQYSEVKTPVSVGGGGGGGGGAGVGGGGGGGAGGGSVYRVTGCGAADVAAHLRLLGESLAIIGERLKEHEGQIAVSGSVSVLLDTLLCSLAPLVCVTRAVPAIAPPADLLQDTLDNIAYIMPGL